MELPQRQQFAPLSDTFFLPNLLTVIRHATRCWNTIVRPLKGWVTGPLPLPRYSQEKGRRQLSDSFRAINFEKYLPFAKVILGEFLSRNLHYGELKTFHLFVA